jgi:hypothetical protein
MNEYINKLILAIKDLKDNMKGHTIEEDIMADSFGWNNGELTYWATPNYDGESENDLLGVQTMDDGDEISYHEFHYKITYNIEEDVKNYFKILNDNIELFKVRQ